MIEKPPRMTLPLGILSAAILFFVSPAPVAAAEDYPSRPIRLIVPFAPGGGTDMVARVIAPKLSERLGGTSVIVDNRGGAGAIIGTAMAAKATPDGYTLLVCDTAHTIQPVLQKLEYDPVKSFSLIASLVTGDSMLVSPASVPAKTLQEFIALAKQKPGQLVAGTAGAGSSGHMALELFRVMAGIDLIMAHYKGAGMATIDLLGGTVHISNVTIQAAVPHLKTGRLRALGRRRTETKRSPARRAYRLRVGFDGILVDRMAGADRAGRLARAGHRQVDAGGEGDPHLGRREETFSEQRDGNRLPGSE